MVDDLERLVQDGATVDDVAALFGVDRQAAREMLVEHGLETRRMRVLRVNREARGAGVREVVRICPRHGAGAFRVDARGTYRCVTCNGERVAARRRRVKELLIAEAGGRCELCGYDRCLRALEFHHRDPAMKEFGIAYRGVTRSLARARAEAAKCVLLCSNCHAEVESGLATIRPAAGVRPHPDPG
ncbi:MAG TPA: hypothetical protein VFZ89_14050 [Solirubrobacteraceae bacterium]